jgi:threonine dehydrogenase-like Zn-dependent dehydrogenase
MRALVFEKRLPRLITTMLLSKLSARAFLGPWAPLREREIARPEVRSEEWVVLRTRLCGICGSDAKQVSLHGNFDNPMTSVISFPQVLGHEVVASVEDVGPAVGDLAPGDRVVLNPWLSCAVRGLPDCQWCESGDFAQCLCFREGGIAPGIHHGNSRDATGGFAPFLPAHRSQCLPIPDGVSDEAAVLADPFSVSLHAVFRNPPPEAGVVLVHGCGTLGLAAIGILRALFPKLRIFAVARFAHQADLARGLGADRIFAHEPALELIEEVAEELGAGLLRSENGLPMLNGGVDRIYDTVTSPGALETGVRITRSRGRIVCLGVEPPRRFEWTPLYFKEIEVVGSNAFGIEQWQGRRQHAFAWYFEMLAEGRVDLSSILTHRVPFGDWKKAFGYCLDQESSGAVKVVLDHLLNARGAVAR